MIAAVTLCLVSTLGIWLNISGNVAGLCVFGILFGFASGSNISLTPVCMGQLCEPEEFGRYYGTMYTIVSIGYVHSCIPTETLWLIRNANRCLTGIPIAGEILNRCKGDYWGLIVFTGLAYAAGLISFMTARIMKVGWKLTAVY